MSQSPRNPSAEPLVEIIFALHPNRSDNSPDLMQKFCINEPTVCVSYKQIRAPHSNGKIVYAV
ncbi:hypothetical protein ACVGW1_00530, partial [Enterobacter intestinihominis]